MPYWKMGKVNIPRGYTQFRFTVEKVEGSTISMAVDEIRILPHVCDSGKVFFFPSLLSRQFSMSIDYQIMCSSPFIASSILCYINFQFNTTAAI